MFEVLKTLKLGILHASFIKLDSRWQYDKVISPFSRLYLITDGEGWVYHNNKKFILKPGYLYLIPSFTYSRYHCDSYLEQYYVHFLDDMEGGLSIYDSLAFTYEAKALEIDEKLFLRLLALNQGRSLLHTDPKKYDNSPDLLSFNLPQPNQTTGEYVESHGILLQVFSRFFTKKNVAETNKKAVHQMAVTLRYIHTHLQEKLTIEKLAANIHLNGDHFSRLFLNMIGVRPMEYINNKRLERAQLLLTTTHTPLKEIAQQVGIPNIYYFSRMFKRKFNIPPGRFREIKWQV
jgi:AraC-like DNA-binding protein